nr:hypothetical protein [uncultured bacterium]
MALLRTGIQQDPHGLDIDFLELGFIPRYEGTRDVNHKLRALNRSLRQARIAEVIKLDQFDLFGRQPSPITRAARETAYLDPILQEPLDDVTSDKAVGPRD